MDPRLGFTSASNAEPDHLCPGRHLAQRGMEGYDRREAESGTMVHAAFAGTLDMDTLSPSQRKTVERGRSIENHMVELWFRAMKHPLTEEDYIGEIRKRAHRELRLWAYRNGQKIHSGGIDALWLAGDMKFALIEDLKSLFGDITEAASNLQLRDYAALVYLNYGCESVSVFINQPNVRWRYDDQRMICYNESDLEKATKDMLARVLASNDLAAARIPGKKQCQFCLACGTDRCPESLQAITHFAKENHAGWSWWSPEERSAFIERSVAVKGIADGCLQHAKEKIRACPGWAEGWEVTPDQQVRKITDVVEITKILTDMFAKDQAHAWEICTRIAKVTKINTGDLEEIHRQLTKQPTQAEREAEFKILFDHLTRRETRSGSLQRKKD